VARVSVSLSGGGHRAALFGLGALLYLADAGKNRDVASIASVSGGSLTNGHLAQSLDYAAASAEEVEAWAATPARRFSVEGTLWASSVTWIYLAALALLAAAVTVGVWFLPAPTWLRILIFAVGLPLVGLAAQLRGEVCGRAFAHTLYTKPGSRRPTRLDEISTSLDHVFCATDLHAGEHVYFSGGFVCAYRFGFGQTGGLPLHTAVQASAAFPGALPARWLRTSRHRFQQPQDPSAARARFLVLADGGVYDNMGDQWAQGLATRKRRWGATAAGLREADELIVVNASAGLHFKSVALLAVPLIGEVMTLVRDKDVLYDNGTSVRREALVARFRLAELQRKGLRGTLVHIAQSPYVVPAAFQNDASDSGRAARSQAALAALGDHEEEWTSIADANSRVGTVLSALGAEASARLVRHAYVLAMVNLHVLLDYPLLPMPDPARFETLVS
jgi:predicted acylesterase/phospholipase RssA